MTYGQQTGGSGRRRALPLIDLTSLNDDDTPERIAALCEQAKAAGVAAVCIYAPFVRRTSTRMAPSSRSMSLGSTPRLG